MYNGRQRNKNSIKIREPYTKLAFNDLNCDNPSSGDGVEAGDPVADVPVSLTEVGRTARPGNACEVNLFNVDESAYPGATPGFATGISRTEVVNVSVPILPTNCLNGLGGQLGTVRVIFANDLAMPTTPTGTDGIANALFVTNTSTGQNVFWPMTLTPGFQTLTISARPGDRISIRIVPLRVGVLTDRFSCTGFFSVP
jgi:hypothetical protein